ncbi:hypothetical protein [Lacticaseibacillus parakribbianus]|uniref:hypothetical protein n=1 Tax=Lacticaseibacillus parakribbianus TaxID=2970927 RepID=UPI0021CB840D|nr:hypothetical protein [Lacticaseibacillus parakribbianus]
MTEQQCPWCGGRDFVEAKHLPYQNVAAKSAVVGLTGRASLCYTVCRDCGTVVRTYVDDLSKVRRWR